MFPGSVCSSLVVVETFLTGKRMLWKMFLIVRISGGAGVNLQTLPSSPVLSNFLIFYGCQVYSDEFYSSAHSSKLQISLVEVFFFRENNAQKG